MKCSRCKKEKVALYWFKKLAIWLCWECLMKEDPDGTENAS